LEKKAMPRKGPARDIKKELYWRGIFRQHRESGLNIREFCRKKGLTEPLFYAWRREVKRRGRLMIGKTSGSTCHADQCSATASNGERRRLTSAKSVRFSPSKPAGSKINGAAFVPIKLSGGIAVSSGFEGVECVLPGGIILRCPADMAPAAIAALVHAWEQGQC
jgi:hypothetical protein